MRDPFNIPAAEFRVVAVHFTDVLVATPLPFGISVPQSTLLGTLFATYDAAFAEAANPNTRTKGKIEAARLATKNLKANMRMLTRIIQANPAVTNEQRADLGIPIPDAEPSPIGVPTDVPVAEVKKMNGWEALIALRTAGSTRRGKPPGVAGANIYTFTGPVAPTDVNLWKFEGETSRADFTVAFDPELAVGTKVWVAICWKNPRFQTGPACAPVGLVIGGGVPTLAQAA